MPSCDKCPATARSIFYYAGEEHHLCDSCRQRLMDTF
jgi:hypothetical protein